jgi:hypothetical protein
MAPVFRKKHVEKRMQLLFADIKCHSVFAAIKCTENDIKKCV